MPKWKLRGFDAFSKEHYDLSGEYNSQEEAENAADKRLNKLEKEQPSSDSGGQRDIQDQVFVIRPDGSKYRYTGLKAVDCTVVVKETSTDLIAKTEHGHLVNIRTNLPDVRRGHRGKIISFEGKEFFIREPYEGDY